MHDFKFSGDCRTIAYVPLEMDRVKVLDAATGAVRYEIRTTGEKPTAKHTTLTPDGRHLLVSQNPAGAWPDVGLPAPDPLWKRALRWLNINPDRFGPKYHDEVMVHDLQSGHEFRPIGWNVSDALLSDDGRTLATTHDEDDGRVLRCWDVDGWKPLRWALGVPTGCGLLFLGFEKCWRRWRKRRPAMPMPPTPA